MGKRRREPLRPEETGPYAELANRPNPAGLILAFTPSLAAMFARAERDQGRSLTPTEAARIRDSAPAVAVSPEQAAALVEKRGYVDVDPNEPFGSWRRMNAD